MKEIRYTDTRGLATETISFSDAVLAGIAPGGGLFVPTDLPHFALQEIVALGNRSYAERAFAIYSAFGVDVPSDRLLDLVRAAYGKTFDDERVAPIKTISPQRFVLELWHGPTLAFKDLALQCMPLFFSEAVDSLPSRGGGDGDYLVLVATSGDTGSAALLGFTDRPHTRIAAFYPRAGVSQIQERQMTTQPGANVMTFEVDGDFDDCQTSVKNAFKDPEFRETLKARHGLTLSSANSINWGRLLPQIVYYFSAYADLVAAGHLDAGAELDVSVPSGNFGNILAAFYARRMGVPLGRLLCASNENSVLADFVTTGTYDTRGRRLVRTPSPSMDILISSNLERLLYELADHPSDVQEWMTNLKVSGAFSVGPNTLSALRERFVGDWVSNDESLRTIREVLTDTGYLIEPHTAVAWKMADRHQGDAPMMVVSPAHWSKFGSDVLRALEGISYDEPLPADLAALSEFDRLRLIERGVPGMPVPGVVWEIEQRPVRFQTTVDGSKEGVECGLLEWLDNPSA